MFVLLVLLALAGSGMVQYLANANLGASGWPDNAVRNWEQYGLLTLKGKIVTNPGGFEALTKPDVYKGHRAASLYPVFFVKRLLAWTGAGTLAFSVALGLTLLLATWFLRGKSWIPWLTGAAAVLCPGYAFYHAALDTNAIIPLSLALLISIWFLLGRSRIAWLAGAAAILCPGYAYYQGTMDPVVTPLLLGLPFAAIVLPLLAKPSLSPAALVVLLLATAAYTALNWTTVFDHGMLLAYLVAARQIPIRRKALYVALAGVSLIVVVGISVLDKAGTGGGFMGFLAGYTWGAKGYGTYLTLDRALVRLLFVGTAGLLPLLLVCGYVLAQRARSNPERLWVAFLPLGVAVISVGLMRNYFGHHPWIAVPAYLVGLILSLRLLVEGRKETSTAPETQAGGKILAPAAFLAGCFVYAAVVTILASLHNSDPRALMTLLRTHTARSDVIVLADTDPSLAGVAADIAEFADRRVVVLKDPSSGEPIGGRAFLLSTSGEVKLPVVARTSQPALASWPLVRELLAFYTARVSRRLPGNQGLKPGTCYLYELNNNKHAANSRLVPRQG
jgi:hypothetical protein